MRNYLIFSLLFILVISAKAQYTQVRIKTFAIDKSKKDSVKFINKTFIVQDTVTYLIKDDNKAVNLGVINISGNKILKEQSIYANLYDKKKKSTKITAFAELSKQNDSLIINVSSSNSWKNIDEILLNNTQFVKSPRNKELPFSVEYTSKTRRIGDYLCKHAIVKENGTIIQVWYTDSMSYNWMFLSPFYKIPGTVISAEIDKENIFQLISVDKIQDEKLIFFDWS